MRACLIICILLPLGVLGQKKKNQKDTSTILSQPERIEFEVRGDGSDFYVVAGEENGILVVEETDRPVTGGGYEWRMHMVDTAFNLLWSQKLSVPNGGTLMGYDYFGGRFYLLYNKGKFRNEDLLVYQFTADSKDFLTYEITTVFPVDISHFESIGESILIAGYTNFRPVVITYDINDKIPRVVPGFYDSKNEMIDLVVDHDSQLFTVIQSERMRNKKFTVRVKTFTSKGDLIQDNLINPGDKQSLIDAASTTFSNGLQYLAGTHSKKSQYYSQGFYLSKFINGAQQFNKYYQFADLNNFFNHLNPKREQRIKNRIEKKKERGKVKRFNYRLLVHKILQRDDEYIMIAEAYYPRYSYGSSSIRSFAPNSFRNPFAGRQSSFNPDFLGYKYTHAVVLGFDRNCNITWDHTFRIEDIQTYSLTENVMVTAVGEKIILTYLQENEIRSKVIEGNEIIEGRTFNPVKLAFEDDEVRTKDPTIEGIEKWYGKTLFAYGVQSIRNENGIAGKLNRKVFYLNKIRFDLNTDI